MSLSNGYAHSNGEGRWWAAITPEGRRLTPQEWKEERQRSITATDLATLAGFGSTVELYHQKLGNFPSTVKETEQMWWGKELEPLILKRWCMITGETIPEDHQQVFMRHPEIDYLAATLDALTLDGEPREWKSLGMWGQDESEKRLSFDSENPPAKWIIQAHGQMIVTGCDEVKFGVFFGPELSLKECTVTRNHDLCGHLLDLAADFRDRLLTRRQPTDFVIGDDKILSVVHNRTTTGPDLDWTEDAELSEVVRRFDEASQAKKVWEKAYELSRAAILSAMGPSVRATCPGYVIKRNVASNYSTRLTVESTERQVADISDAA